jgi:hypothetical protein
LQTQVHDFTGGIGPNGIFWIVKVPDDDVKTTEEGAVTISLTNAAIVDQTALPGSLFIGSSGSPATLSLNMTFRKNGPPRIVRPTSASPISPHSWAGEVSDATYMGTFSVAYMDGKFSAHGDFGSTASEQVFAEMGTERNGSFVRREDENEQGAAARQVPGQAAASVAAGQLGASATLPANSPRWRGKVPVEYLVH